MDMRLRLGLLQSNLQTERQAARDAEAQAKKRKQQIPTVKTEEQLKADEAAAAREKELGEEPPPLPKPRIRPLSEAKAIDMGANFLSEAFLFLVAGSLIVFESWRSRRKETSRREDVADRLAELESSERAARIGLIALEKEIIRLRAQVEKKSPKELHHILPEELRSIEEEPEEEVQLSIFQRLAASLPWTRHNRTENTTPGSDTVQQNSSKPAPNPNAPRTNPS